MTMVARSVRLAAASQVSAIVGRVPLRARDQALARHEPAHKLSATGPLCFKARGLISEGLNHLLVLRRPINDDHTRARVPADLQAAPTSHFI